MFEGTLGIDISKKELAVALIIGNKISKNKFANNQQGFAKLNQWLSIKAIKDLKVCMEATGSYGDEVAEFLYNQGYSVSIINPACIKAYASSKLKRHKTDEVDAVLIAEYANKNELHPYKPRDSMLKKLRSFYRCQQNLKIQRTQVSNYLENEHTLPDSISIIYRRLLNEIDLQIKSIDLLIDELLTNNSTLKEHCENLQSIPGVGKITAIAILSEVPDFSSFNSARQLAAYAGLTPKQNTSGTSVRGKSRLSKIGSSNLRKALYFPAISAKSHNSIVKEFANKLKNRGKNTMVIIGAIMRKLLHIAFGVIKHKTKWNH